MKKVFIYSNKDNVSSKTKNKLVSLLKKAKITVQSKFNKDTELMIVIGGDGTFLNAIKNINFSNVLVLGINTGHLGFFADYSPNELNEVVKVCNDKKYLIQTYKTIKTVIEKKDKTKKELDLALNDIYVKHGLSSLAHLDLSIGDSLVESIVGDGLLISSSAGSTAYNYSLGASIVDPRLDLLQIKPVAPSNNAVYRSLTSSLLVPSGEKIVIVPKDNDVIVVVDGKENTIKEIKRIIVSTCDKTISVIRKPDYKFWNKVKSKFL